MALSSSQSCSVPCRLRALTVLGPQAEVLTTRVVTVMSLAGGTAAAPAPGRCTRVLLGSACSCTPVLGSPELVSPPHQAAGRAALRWFLRARLSLSLHAALAGCGLRASSSEGPERGRGRQRPTRRMQRAQGRAGASPHPSGERARPHACGGLTSRCPARVNSSLKVVQKRHPPGCWGAGSLSQGSAGCGSPSPAVPGPPAAALPPRGDLESECCADTGIYLGGRELTPRT